jgi:hypothetical protein
MPAMPDVKIIDRGETAGQEDRRSRRILWSVVAALGAVVVAAAVAGVLVVRHYYAAPDLEGGSASGWMPPENLHGRTVGDRIIVAARPPARQSFFVSVRNPASVTQTILGITPDLRALVYRPVLSGTRTADPAQPVPPDPRDFAGPPIAIPPHQVRYLRLSLVGLCLSPGGGVEFDAIDLRVRRGAFTRTETVVLPVTFVIEGNASSIAHCPIH